MDGWARLRCPTSVPTTPTGARGHASDVPLPPGISGERSWPPRSGTPRIKGPCCAGCADFCSRTWL
eukprot:354266-Chlamydomonas_euryale.AAC.4